MHFNLFCSVVIWLYLTYSINSQLWPAECDSLEINRSNSYICITWNLENTIKTWNIECETWKSLENDPWHIVATLCLSTFCLAKLRIDQRSHINLQNNGTEQGCTTNTRPFYCLHHTPHVYTPPHTHPASLFLFTTFNSRNSTSITLIQYGLQWTFSLILVFNLICCTYCSC